MFVFFGRLLYIVAQNTNMRILLILLLAVPAWLHAQPLKPAAWYLKHPKVSKKAKTLYRMKTVSLPQAEHYFSVLDSLQTTDSATRPFYFSLLPKLTRHADGYVAEVIGMKYFELLERKPQYVFSFFTSNPARKSQMTSMARHAAFGMQMWCPAQHSENGEPLERESCYELFEKQVREKCSGTALADGPVYKEFMGIFKGSQLW